MHRSVLVVVMSLFAAVSCARAQTGTTALDGAMTGARRTSLTDYDGVYAYHGATSLALVSTDSLVFAVIDEAKYPLRPLGADRFVNAGGDTIPFRRGVDGKVSGFVERGTYFARRTPLVDVETIASVRTKPRALGADGRPRAYAYSRPVERHDGIAVGDAAAAGIDPSSIARLVGRVVNGTYSDVHSILVYRGGRLVVEEYFYDYDAGRPHQLRSATKSVVSALVGIAVERGMLESDTARVMRYLPYDAYANADARKDRLTIRDLLTMRSGLACDDWDAGSPGNESRVYRSGDWVKFVLDLPMTDAPGTRGRYCSGNVAVAGRIVERVAHTALPVFARQQLFAPLGIRTQDVRWNYTLDSTNAATFAQLYLRPRDMLKLGMLYQQGGRWNGRQIISRDWVARSVQAWSTVGDQPYGYFWWHQWVDASTPQGTRRVDMVDASGNGGQKIYLVPSLDLIVVLTGGSYNVSSPATGIMAKEILPAVLSGSAAPRLR